MPKMRTSGEMEMNQKVEFIESYIKIGNGDYQWNDNHGELIRCKDCKWFHKLDSEKNLCECIYHGFITNEDKYCWWGEKDA